MPGRGVPGMLKLVSLQTGAAPGACIVSYRMAAPCDSCGRQACPVHMPRLLHGLYCAECCPVCGEGRDDTWGDESGNTG